MIPDTELQLPQLACRIAAARKNRGLKQEEMANALNFENRQSLAAIEAGERSVSPDELIRIMEVTGCDMDYFTDPFRLVGEGAFSYRATKTTSADLDAFEIQARSWIAMWRHLGECRGESGNLLRLKLSLKYDSTYEEAQKAAISVAEELRLSGFPAEQLADAIPERLGILILFVDMPLGMSSAACQLSSGDVILINRGVTIERQAFDIAHELFHVLTWDAMPPGRIDHENPSGYKKKCMDRLADKFAGALLMPEDRFRNHWNKKPADCDLSAWIESAAYRYRVSAGTLVGRLVSLGLLSKETSTTLRVTSIKRQDEKMASKPYSRRFLDRIAWGISHGEISVRRLKHILGISVSKLRATFDAHGVSVEIGL